MMLLTELRDASRLPAAQISVIARESRVVRSKNKAISNHRPEKMQTGMKSYQGLSAYVTALVNQELLLQVEYLAAENRILREHRPS
jgi:hypothetical protein